MTDEELIEILWNGEVTLGAVASAAIRIQELSNQQTFIREAALREAWKAVNKVFNGFPNHASDAILALIGENK